MDNEKKPTREEIVRSLRCCREDVNIPKCRAECVFFPGVVPAACAPALCGAAADLIDELTDRCARYAEEIMELRQVNDLSGASRHLPLKGEARAVEDASPYEAGTDRAV